ncbi:protein-(glutamine-N5) methyltransferase, release factor-specific [Desulfuromonas soudanensis]|uniref:Release factor glutamine methyltransferase n=1 Tax=Desulfuromonas soudanensis TaxID=1603606 RepID=A0A0M4D3T5_9BACT|nr:protein-(glutamine-N5) methyltransferase, release factor-specific [Desulfuromonas soudanensis]
MSENWTVLKVLQWTAGYLGSQGVEGARRDAELLLTDILGLDRVGLYLNYDRPLESAELAAFRGRVARRARREPLQYILGSTEFWSLPLTVTPAVLIPRADTEILVEEALARCPASGAVLDVGTGSGAIAIAIASERPAARVEGVDLSLEALAVAEGNVRRHALEGRLTLRQDDLAALTGGPWDLIVSNPPYIAEGELAGLMPEVRDFEPRQALAGGEDGLDCYRHLAGQASHLLVSGGWLLVEVGLGQAAPVKDLFAAVGLDQTFLRNDYAGIPRVVGGQKR